MQDRLRTFMIYLDIVEVETGSYSHQNQEKMSTFPPYFFCLFNAKINISADTQIPVFIRRMKVGTAPKFIFSDFFYFFQNRKCNYMNV